MSTTVTPPQPTYVEEPAFYYFTTVLTALEKLQGISVNIDRDSDFLLTGINGSSDSTFTMNFKLPSGRLIASQQMLASDLLGSSNQPNAIGPPPIYRAGSVGPQLDLTDTSNADNTVRIVFAGIRRIRTT